MRSLAVARQPILDRKLSLVGYELLFRAGEDVTANVVDAEAATSRVIIDGFMEAGLDELVGSKLAYINVTRAFLLMVRPLPLPTERVVVELLEGAGVDEQLLAVLDELNADGFAVALDDFAWRDGSEELLARAQIVKINVLARDASALQDLVGRLRERPERLLLVAEKVETRADYERCLGLGFDLFQGYFFARPLRVQTRNIPGDQLGGLNAMTEISLAHDFDELEEIIARDVGLSVRLLRYANSAQIYLPRRVDSVHDALNLIGAATVRRWALMLSLAGFPDAPRELLVTALVRARMCQLLAASDRDGNEDAAFTVGLFSVADALLDAPIESVVESLPFSDSIAGALVDHSGPLGQRLDCVLAYENGDFDAVERLPRSLVAVDNAYREAVAWADLAAAGLA